MPEKKNDVRQIGVISDSHVPTRAGSLPPEIYTHFTGVDFIIHCGDLVEENVLTELGTIAPVYAVKGNMDPADIMEPSEQVFEINNKFIICVSHGTGSPFDIKERLYKKFTRLKPYMILFGHTHLPEISSFRDVIFFNPGSCTQGHDYNSIGILDIKNDVIDCKIIPL